MISILTVTHNRPHWLPWLFHQVDKQTTEQWEHVIVSTEPVDVSGRRNTRVFVTPASIPLQRNVALGAARGRAVVWFDDDDWQSPYRLARWDSPEPTANRWSYVVPVHAPERCERQGYEPFIFNSACVPRAGAPEFNQLLQVDEDVDWVRRVPMFSYRIITEPLFAWMSHGQNVTNSTRGRLFEERCPIRFDSTELAMLKDLSGQR